MKKNYTIGKIAIKYGLWFVTGMILSFVTAGITIFSNDVVAKVVDDVISGKNELSISESAFTILIMAVAMLVITFLYNVISKLYSIKVQQECKERIAEKLPDIEYRYFDDNGSGSIMNKLISDVGELNKLFSENIPTLVTSVIVVSVVVVYMLFLDWKLSIVTIVVYPILIYLANFVSNRVKKLVNLRKNLLDERTEVANDCIQGIVVGKSYNLEKEQDKRIGKVIDTVFSNEKARTQMQSLSYVLESIIGWIPVVISYVIALFEVLNGNITAGEMLAFSVLLGLVSQHIEKIPMTLIEYKEYMVSVKRLNQILQAKEEATGDVTEGKAQEVAIEFTGVKFSYNQDSENVLKGIDFVARTGEQTAIIGSSGGGKSTIFRLLCGFYQLREGSYKLFGEEFDKWNLKAARNKISLVSQNVFLLPESIATNVAYGKRNATREEVIEACKKANIHNFIMSLPQGYDTLVGERGVRLSGGERQRISIARAFLKDAPILLLDEPTSAIDVETEKMIQEAIDRISEGKTVIVIAHRLNTVVNVNKIYVLGEGVIKESGTHKELIELNGIYSELYGKQLECEGNYA